MNTKLIFLQEINMAESPVVRFGNPNADVVERYAQSYTDKKEMPPVVVFYDESNKQFYLADGRHRCAAVASIGRKAIMATIHAGTLLDAIKFALLANSQHGVPRTQADRRKCIEVALKQWPEASNLHLANLTDTSDKTVAAVREEMEKARKIKASDTRVSTTGAKIAAKRSGKDEDDPPRVKTVEKFIDKLGREIPFGVDQYWERTNEVNKILEEIANLSGFLKRSQVEKDPMYAEVNFNGVLGDLERIHANVATAIPYCVCTVCQGQPQTQKNGCRLCCGRGLISKFRYDTAVPKETKAIIEKSKKK